MELLAIPGSVRQRSYNRALLEAMSRQSAKYTNITLFNRLRDIPVFDPDVAEADMPEPVAELQSHIRKADGIIISTPEYAHGVPGVLKNLLDWFVSSDALVLKPVVVTSVSTSAMGGVRAHSPLVMVLNAMNTNVVVEGSMTVPYARKKFDAELNLIDDQTRQAIAVSLSALEQAINAI